MSELWAPWKYVVSFNPHIPLKTISMVFFLPYYPGGFPRWYSGECIHLSMQETKEMWVQSLGREILWRRKCLPTQVFLPGKFHGQRSLESSSLWSGKELYMTERLTHTHTRVPGCILLLYYPWGEWGQGTHPSRSNDSKGLIWDANPVSLILVPIISMSC